MLEGFAEQSAYIASHSSDVGCTDDCDVNDSWTHLKSKKELRRERKKRKLLALSAVMMLNEQDGHTKNSAKTSTTDEHKGERGAVAATHANDEQLKKILEYNHTAYAIGDSENEKKKVPAESTTVAKRRRHDSIHAVRDNAAGDSVKCKALADGNDKAAGALQSDAEYQKLKAYVNQKRSMRYTPRILLKPIGQKALLDRYERKEERIPLLLDDIQALLMHTFLRVDSPVAPRWVSIEKNTKLTHTIVLIVEGFSCEDFVTHREQMATCASVFGAQHTLQVVCPAVKLLEEIACVPLSDTHKDILVAEYGSLEAAMRFCKDQMLVRRSIFRNIGPSHTPNYTAAVPGGLPKSDKFPRTLLLLSPIQMINEGFPLPLSGTLEHRFNRYVTTSDQYKPVTPHSPMFGLDCEMCGAAGDQSVLTRVSVVNESGKIVYNELVKPHVRIVNYRTPFSGITADMLKNVTKRLADVQRDLRKLLPPDAILVGHSLNSDLEAMEMLHPYVIDTSIVYNVSSNPMHKQKLRVLTKKFLDKDIQCNESGHDSIEDCAASLDLVKLKLANSIYFGDQWLEDRRNYHSYRSASERNGIAEDVQMQPGAGNGNDSTASQITSTLFSLAKKRNKRSVIVTNANEELRTFETYFGDAIPPETGDSNLSQQWLKFCKTFTASGTISKTAANCLQYDFNLAYAKLFPDDEADKATDALQIDGWVKQLHNAISLNGLLVVLLVGHESDGSRANESNNRTAVAMLQTKKPPK
uniref:Exonuclease domain-containing protein n=1 Tax=Anopheles farauti TaxID=69004 RepID=A0A182Q9W9_9DIPT